MLRRLCENWRFRWKYETFVFQKEISNIQHVNYQVVDTILTIFIDIWKWLK